MTKFEKNLLETLQRQVTGANGECHYKKGEEKGFIFEATGKNQDTVFLRIVGNPSDDEYYLVVRVASKGFGGQVIVQHGEELRIDWFTSLWINQKLDRLDHEFKRPLELIPTMNIDVDEKDITTNSESHAVARGARRMKKSLNDIVKL